MENQSALAHFTTLPESKTQVEQYFKLIRESVLDGEVEPLKFAVIISAMEKLFSSLKKDHLIKDCILEESEKYGAKSFEYSNAKFNIREVGVKYDFNYCMDVEWERLDSDGKRIAALKKERETFLKTINPGIEIFGSDGVQLQPPAKSSTTSVAITLK